MKNVYFWFVSIVVTVLFVLASIVPAQQGNVIVPNVEGISLEVAAQIIRTTGLQPKMLGSSVPSAIVIWQNPRAGFTLAVGGDVTISTSAISITTLQPEGESSAFRQPLSVSPDSGGVSGVMSVGTVTVTPTGDVGAEFAGAPQAVSPQRDRITTYQTAQEGEFTILYQPQQTPANKYLLADTRPKKYPPWYPKEFLKQGAPQAMSAQPQGQYSGASGQVQVLSGTSGGSSLPVDTPSQWYGWHSPDEWTSWDDVRYSTSSIQVQPGISSDQGVYTQAQPSAPGAVVVPNVIRLRQQDAVFAIQKAGLSVGRITRVQDARLGGGLIKQQSPRARAIVPAGTQVELWVAD